jgi:hypothetical protein
MVNPRGIGIRMVVILRQSLLDFLVLKRKLEPKACSCGEILAQVERILSAAILKVQVEKIGPQRLKSNFGSNPVPPPAVPL